MTAMSRWSKAQTSFRSLPTLRLSPKTAQHSSRTAKPKSGQPPRRRRSDAARSPACSAFLQSHITIHAESLSWPNEGFRHF